MVGLTLLPSLCLQSRAVLAPWHGRQQDWRFSQHNRSSRVIHDRQDVIHLPGESLYWAESHAALANFAVRVGRQLLRPQPLPGAVVTSVACGAPTLGGLLLRLPAVSLASARFHQLSTSGIRARAQRSCGHHAPVPACGEGVPSLPVSFGGTPPGRIRFRAHTR